MAVHLRPMDAGDLDCVMHVEVRAYAFPWTRGIFIDCLRANYECWVLEKDDEVIGHGVLSVAAGEAHLLNVCICRDHQGFGFGRTLVEHMLDRAQRRAAEVVFLEVRLSNEVSCRYFSNIRPTLRVVRRLPNLFTNSGASGPAFSRADNLRTASHCRNA